MVKAWPLTAVLITSSLKLLLVKQKERKMSTHTSYIDGAADPQRPSKAKRFFIGYVRVSTTKQARDGNSLEVQRAQIEAYADELGADLIDVHQDSASSFMEKSAKRPDFQAAIKQAISLNTPLLVPTIDRLSRNMDDLGLLLSKDLKIVSADRGRVTRAVLKSLVAKAEAASNAKSVRGKSQHKLKSKNPQKVPDAFIKGRALGSEMNKIRSLQRNEEIAKYLRENVGAQKLTHNKLVQLLNKDGPHNLKSGVDSIRIPWTKDALRPVRKRAMKLLETPQASEGPTGLHEPLMVSTVPLGPAASLSQAPSAGATSKERTRNEQIDQVLATDCSKRRGLSGVEKFLLQEICKEEGLNNSALMDELDLKRAGSFITKGKDLRLDGPAGGAAKTS
jgi:hypothetical protein